MTQCWLWRKYEDERISLHPCCIRNYVRCLRLLSGVYGMIRYTCIYASGYMFRACCSIAKHIRVNVQCLDHIRNLRVYTGVLLHNQPNMSNCFSFPFFFHLLIDNGIGIFLYSSHIRLIWMFGELRVYVLATLVLSFTIVLFNMLCLSLYSYIKAFGCTCLYLSMETIRIRIL